MAVPLAIGDSKLDYHGTREEGQAIADYITDEEADAIGKHIAEHGITRIPYLSPTPAEKPRRINLTWGKGKKMVRPVKRVVKK